VSDDNRDLIERSITKNVYGAPLPLERMAEKFRLHGLKTRVAALESFDSELRCEIESSSHNLRQRAQMMDMRRRMGAVHEALRKAGR
jgi:hypothetical protein